MTTTSERVNAAPTKSFFVDMLTRDISVVDSLLDLCDNALGRTFELADADPSDIVVAGNTRAKPLKPFKLAIQVTPSLIRLEDNCGGISQEHAQNDIFRLGRDADDRPEKGLSVYGIGMKRAFFKLADDVSLRSSHQSEWFEISFTVSEWKKTDDWTLSFARRGSSSRPTDIPRNGTVIELKDLRPTVKDLIATRAFIGDLRRRLESTYSLFIASGLSLTLNGEPIERAIPVVADEPIKAGRKSLTLNKVKVLILAGLVPKSEPATAATSGWFAYCNGRLVLDAEKSRISGWGDGLPQWHNKFSRFVGYVFFNSNDSRLLPWTTTKQGLVDDSEVFQKTRQEMQVQARPVLDFLSRMYPGDLPEEGVQERQVLNQASAVALSEVKRADRPFTTPASKSKSAPSVSIQYKKPKQKVEQAKTKLGRGLSAAEIGSRTFDYFIKNECAE